MNRRWFVAVLVLLVLVMSGLASVRWELWTYGSDTGTFAQAIANALHGFTDGPEGGSHLRFHWSPILALLTPLVLLTRSVFILQIVQVALILATAVPLYALVRSYANEVWAARCGILSLIYPPLLATSFGEFHELAFFPVLSLGIMWAADRARWTWFAVLALAVVLVKEDLCVETAILGIVLAVIGALRQHTNQRGLLLGEPREPRRLILAGAGLTALSIGALLIYILVVLPRVGAWPQSHFYSYSFASGPWQTMLAVFVHPWQLATAVFTLGRFTYLLEALVPLAFLPFGSRWTLLSLPAFASVLLSSDPSVWRMGFHYALAWVPWLLLGATWTLVRVLGTHGERPAQRWWLAAIVACAVFLVAFNPLHPLHYLAAPYKNTVNVLRALACVPQAAPVITDDEWFAHIALRYPLSSVIDGGAGTFDGYVVFSKIWPQDAPRLRFRQKILAAYGRGEFRLVCRYGDVLALVRQPAARARLTHP